MFWGGVLNPPFFSYKKAGFMYMLRQHSHSSPTLPPRAPSPRSSLPLSPRPHRRPRGRLTWVRERLTWGRGRLTWGQGQLTWGRAGPGEELGTSRGGCPRDGPGEGPRGRAGGAAGGRVTSHSFLTSRRYTHRYIYIRSRSYIQSTLTRWSAPVHPDSPTLSIIFSGSLCIHTHTHAHTCANHIQLAWSTKVIHTYIY